MTAVVEVRELLAGTSLPADLVSALIEGASPLWLLGQSAEQVAGDLALCHPALGPDEVRVIVHPLAEARGHKVSVVAPDRPGLLAGTAGALAAAGLTIRAATASSWPSMGLALQRVLVDGPASDRPVAWDFVGDDLRRALTGAGPRFRFTPCPPVTVSCTDSGGDRVVVTVRAPDRVGLLWAIAAWFEARGCNIEVATAEAEDGMASDTFVVHGGVDPDALFAHLAGRPPTPLPWPLTRGLATGLAVGRSALRVAAVPLRAALRR
ncbi:MAG TPA: hypothetical protein VGP53_04130 [Acidimicrobiales bacterium]|nr:hypothetical protein [Acidimicrobiales bacterium]